MMKAWLRRLLLGVGVGIFSGYGVSLFMGGAAVAQTPLPDVGHYRCYLSIPNRTITFAPPLSLQDEFKQDTISTARARYACVPVSKDGSPIFNPDVQLMMYGIVGPAFPAKQRPHLSLQSLNPHFPPEEVTLIKPAFLLVPSVKQTCDGMGPSVIICG